MMNSDPPTLLKLGYDIDKWNNYGLKVPIHTDISPSSNSHILLSGISGAGKSYHETAIFSKLVLAELNGEYHFADYKQDDAFIYLRGCPRYYGYKNTLQALDAVYARLQARQSGADTSRHACTLIWDEYVANILALTNQDKKEATVVLNKVGEILMLGRSLKVRLFASMQRPDAIVFPAGARNNFGVVVVLGAANTSIYDMLLPDFKDKLAGRYFEFERGEGVVVLQGAKLHCIKVATVQNVERIQRLCTQALS